MAGHGERLSRKQESFIAALLLYPTVKQAAGSVGISIATSTRWLKEPRFKEAYAQARRDALEQILGLVEQSMTASVLVLRSVMLAADTPAPTKVAAAKVLLETGLRCFELHDQEHRIAALEAERRAIHANSQ